MIEAVHCNFRGTLGNILIHLLKCEFKNSDLEERFRQTTFEATKIHAKIGLLVMAFAMLIFIRTDKIYISDQSVSEEVLYLRLFYSVMTFVMLFLWTKTRIYQMGDIIILVWSLFSVIVISFINATRDSEFLYHHITDVLIIISFYVFFPNRFIYQVIPSMIFSLTNVIVFSNLDVISVLEINTVAFAHIAVNFIGIYASYKNQKFRRVVYEKLQEQNFYNEYT